MPSDSEPADQSTKRAVEGRPRAHQRDQPQLPGSKVLCASFHQKIPEASHDRPASTLEQMAEVVATGVSTRQELLGLLLETMSPLGLRGRPVLGPLWANEAIQRAYDWIRLVARLDQCVPLCARDCAAARAESRLALQIAATFRALDGADDEHVLPCSDLLRTLVHDLIELFGPISGGIDVRTSIEPLLLPAYKRRALVLVACALVTEVLGGELSDRSCGDVTVTLSHVAEAKTLLRVVDSGRRVRGGACVRPPDVVVDLAALLESDPVYRIGAAGGLAVELVFPL
jgi:hypothetical protein